MQSNTTPAQPKKLLDHVRDKIRFKPYSLSTENTYLSWIKQLILRRQWHERDMELNKVDVWLPDALAVKYPNTSKKCNLTCTDNAHNMRA